MSSLSRRKNRVWLRQRERTREQLAAHATTLAQCKVAMELLADVSATRDNLRGTLELALKDRAEMLSEVKTLRAQLEKFTVGADAGKPGDRWVN